MKRFSKAGKLLKTCGKAGGRRPEGAYDQPTSFYCVDDIAADGSGGFFILEPGVAPRRTTHLDTKGRIVSEWYGGQMFFQYACPDPADPTLVWMDSHWGWLMQAKVDYKKRTWRVLATYHYDGMASGLISGTGNSGCKWRIVRKDKAAYLIRDSTPVVLRIDEKLHRLVPLAASSTNITHYWDSQPKFIKDLLNNDRQSKSLSYVWADSDGDGMPQKEEVTFSEWSAWWGGWSMNDDFSVFASGDGKVFGLEPTSLNKLGAPVYGQWGKFTEILRAPEGVPGPGGYGACRALFRDQAGNTFAIFNEQDKANHHGWGWPADMFHRTGVMKWTADGKPAWVVGRHANTRPNPPGETHNPVQIIGMTHDCVVIGERVVQPALAWDQDGLFVGTFFDGRADDGLPKEIYCWWQATAAVAPDGSKGSPLPDGAINYDCLVGGAIHTEPKGDVLWFAPGWNNTMVYRVTGWDGWRRQKGSVTVPAAPPSAVRQGTGLQAAYFTSRDLAGQPAISRVDEQVAFFWKDGSPEQGKLNANDFSIRWEGFVEAEFTEDYTFSTYAKDGARLWLDGNPIIDAWKDYAGERWYHYTYNENFTKTLSKPVRLQAGRKYPIKLEYYKGAAFKDNNESRIQLNWESPTRQRQIVPKEFLYPAQ
ncbi:MAG TPA: PA14 domain-containing protein [Planctomycetota bacterium]|nr:PA14 domain-containing protein [Planctomycetota bacterium]